MVNAFANCTSPRCSTRRVAGDVGAALMVIRHPDYTELVILRTMPPSVFFDGAKPGPPLDRLDVGDPLRLYVCGLIGDLGARERAGNLLRHTAQHLAAAAVSP